MITVATDPIAPYLTTYFRDHLVRDRNLSPNTLMSYRDALRMMLLFSSRATGRPCTELTFGNFDADFVRGFLNHLEVERQNSVRSRNQRLAAIRSFFEYVARTEPQLAAACQAITSIPLKRGSRETIDYLDEEELDTIFAEIDRRQPEGQRDFTLLLFTYNSGARVQEVADLRVSWLTLCKPFRVNLLGKGRKWRICPLWKDTGEALRSLLADRPATTEDQHVFLNRYGAPLSRHGIFNIVKKYVARAAVKLERLASKRISPHTIRHTTAMHLLQSGVELSVIRSWLGHSSVETTNQYCHIDLQMKAKALERCEARYQHDDGVTRPPSWKASPDILAWLKSL